MDIILAFLNFCIFIIWGFLFIEKVNTRIGEIIPNNYIVFITLIVLILNIIFLLKRKSFLINGSLLSLYFEKKKLQYQKDIDNLKRSEK